MSRQLILASLLLALLAGSCHAQDACGSTLLSLHNQDRAQHQAGPLQWDDGLAGSAQSWANQLASQGCGLHHSGSGENLYASWNAGGDQCSAAAQAWYNEVSNYVFSAQPWTNNQGHFGSIGHFTQMVWRSASRLGCALAAGSGNCQVVVCHYDTGNVIGDQSFADNVLPASGGSGGTPTGPTTGSGPQDQLQWCSSWASQGYCEACYVYQGARVRDLCAASCAGSRRRAAARRLAAGSVAANSAPQPVVVKFFKKSAAAGSEPRPVLSQFTKKSAAGSKPVPDHVGTGASSVKMPLPVRSIGKAA